MLKIKQYNNKFIFKVRINNTKSYDNIIINALFDTGATDTILLSSVIETLNLEIGNNDKSINTVNLISNTSKCYKSIIEIQNIDKRIECDVYSVNSISKDDIQMVIGMNIILLGTTLIENEILNFNIK